MRLLRSLTATAGVLLTAVLAGLVLAPSRDVTTSIHIDAPPSSVWAVLTDTGAYPAWNRGMVLRGALIQGNTIEHDEGEGADRLVFHPVIVTAVPDRALSWQGHFGVPRVLDALHGFTLAPEAGGTRFTQREHLRGVLLWIWDARQLVPRFEAMNAALKARVEAGAAQPAATADPPK